MAQRKLKLKRKCRTCDMTFEVTAKEIKAHEVKCPHRRVK